MNTIAGMEPVLFFAACAYAAVGLAIGALCVQQMEFSDEPHDVVPLVFVFLALSACWPSVVIYWFVRKVV